MVDTAYGANGPHGLEGGPEHGPPTGPADAIELEAETASSTIEKADQLTNAAEHNDPTPDRSLTSEPSGRNNLDSESTSPVNERAIREADISSTTNCSTRYYKKKTIQEPAAIHRRHIHCSASCRRRQRSRKESTIPNQENHNRICPTTVNISLLENKARLESENLNSDIGVQLVSSDECRISFADRNIRENPLAIRNQQDTAFNNSTIPTPGVCNRINADVIGQTFGDSVLFQQSGLYTRVVLHHGDVIRVPSSSQNRFYGTGRGGKSRGKFVEFLQNSNDKVRDINDKVIGMARAMTPAWSLRLLGVSCGSVVCAWGLLLILSVLGGASHSTGIGNYGFDSSGTMDDLVGTARCPWVCQCGEKEVDCAQQGLTQVPGDLAVLAEKL